MDDTPSMRSLYLPPRTRLRSNRRQSGDWWAGTEQPVPPAWQKAGGTPVVPPALLLGDGGKAARLSSPLYRIRLVTRLFARALTCLTACLRLWSFRCYPLPVSPSEDLPTPPAQPSRRSTARNWAKIRLRPPRTSLGSCFPPRKRSSSI